MGGSLRRCLMINPVSSLFAAILLLLAVIQSLSGIEFQASGEIETESFTGVKGIQTETFEVYVRDDNWLIKIHQLSFPNIYTNVMLLDYSSFNHGDCVYTFASPRNSKKIIDRLLASTNAPEVWRQNPEKLAINMAWIDKASMPHADMRLSLLVVFYAFCSQAYLDSVTNNRLEPPYFVDGRLYPYDDGATNVLAKYSRFETAPFLPRAISFMHGDKWLVDSGVWYRLSEQWVGFTNAEFSTTTYTNIGGLRLPSIFELTVYEAGQGKKEEALSITPETRIHGYVKTAKDKCDLGNDLLKPSPVGYATMADKRIFSDGLPLIVRYDANKWLNREEVVQLKEFRYAQREHAAMLERLGTRQTGASGRIVLAAILVLSPVFLLILYLRRFRKQPTTTLNN